MDAIQIDQTSDEYNCADCRKVKEEKSEQSKTRKQYSDKTVDGVEKWAGKKEKRYSTKVPSGDFMTMPAKPHKTHKMQPDGKPHILWQDSGSDVGERCAYDRRADVQRVPDW